MECSTESKLNLNLNLILILSLNHSDYLYNRIRVLSIIGPNKSSNVFDLTYSVRVAEADPAANAVVSVAVAGATPRDEAEALAEARLNPLSKVFVARLQAALPKADFLLFVGMFQTSMCAPPSPGPLPTAVPPFMMRPLRTRIAAFQELDPVLTQTAHGTPALEMNLACTGCHWW